MRRDIFRRGVRMQHFFGTLEQTEDPLDRATFDPRFPERINQLRSPPITAQAEGEHRPFGARSAIVKPSGRPASASGPRPDPAAFIIERATLGTARRCSCAKR